MDPVIGGAAKHIQQELFQQAEQQIQKSNQQVSDFEKLRDKLEQQDAISNLKFDQLQQIHQPQQTDQVNQIQQTDPSSEAGKVTDLQGAEIPQIKSMDELQSMVNDIRGGQSRLNQIISEATSGKTYSPSEMIGMQAEVGKITQSLELMTKVVEHFVNSIKTTMQMQV